MVQQMGTATAFSTGASSNLPSSEGALADICMSSERSGNSRLRQYSHEIFDCPDGSRPLSVRASFMEAW